MTEQNNTSKASRLAELTEQTTKLADSLFALAQLCLNESKENKYLPGDLTRLHNSFGLIDKRLKLAKFAANELSFSCSQPL